MKRVNPSGINIKTVCFILITSLLLGTGCEGFETETPAEKAHWTIQGQEKNTSNISKFENNVLSAESTVKGQYYKLYVKFGSKPTSSANMKVVDYYTTPLAADEMTIGIRDGDYYYLSTGLDNVSISPAISYTNNTPTNLTITFNNIQVQKNTIGNQPLNITTASGFISEK